MSLHIPTPCHEDWNQMSPEGRGRFCGSCSKVVVDFTVMTDDEVRNYLLQHSSQHTCGRFYTRQLDQPAREQNISLPRHWFERLPYSRQLFYAVALFFILGVTSCNFSGAQTGSNNNSITQGAAATVTDTVIAVPDTPRHTIKPAIAEPNTEMGEPLQGMVEVEPATTGIPVFEPPPSDTLVEPPIPVIMGGISAPEPPPQEVPATAPSVPPAPQPEGRIDAPSAPPVIKGKVRLSEK